MTLKERARHWLGVKDAPPPPEPPRAAPSTPTRPGSHVVEKRFRLSEDNPTVNYLQGLTILAPFDPENRWRNLQLDENSLDTMSSAQILELLCDLSPEISRAHWDLLRLCNPGWQCHAYKPGTETEDKKAQAWLDQFLNGQLRGLYGSPDVPINRIYTNAFLRGAFMAELVLDNRGKVPLDIAVPDAQWTYFRIAVDPQRGPVWQPYQFQHGRPVPLILETIRYIPLDPLPASPYGRPMCSPALFTTLFSLGLLHDLKRVVQQQGYPRIDVAIKLEELAKAMPADLADDPAQYQDWLNAFVASVGKAYASLEPDDAFVHSDVIEVNRPIGTLDSSSLGAMDGLTHFLERQVVRALKTMPLLMGVNEASSETHANRQWEVHVAGIRSVQRLHESLMEHMLSVGLRVQGMQATVEFRFDELRNSELLRDGQVEQLRTQNAALQYDRGYLSQDEACQLATGKPKADQAAPRIEGVGTQGGSTPPPSSPGSPAAIEPEPGSKKSMAGNGRRMSSESVGIPDGVDGLIKESDQAMPTNGHPDLLEALRR